MRQFADMFKYRRNPPPARTTQVEVRLLCSDAKVKTLTVHIPETTPARDMLSAASAALYAQQEATGDRYRIHHISIRPVRASTADLTLPVNAEGPIWSAFSSCLTRSQVAAIDAWVPVVLRREEA